MTRKSGKARKRMRHGEKGSERLRKKREGEEICQWRHKYWCEYHGQWVGWEEKM